MEKQNEEISIKKLPIGVDNFEKLIKDGYYYADKTLMVKDLLDRNGDATVFTRPRRFGKSLGLSMLQYYFENLKKDKAKIFSGLATEHAGAKYREHRNKYPVIQMSLKDVAKITLESSMKLLISEISREFERHDYILASPLIRAKNKELYQRLSDKMASFDEYDVPLEKAYFSGYYDKMVDFIRTFLGAALKSNNALKFAIITGCLGVSKESIFTGINNLHMISIL